MNVFLQKVNIIEMAGIGFLLFFFIYGINFTFLPVYTSQLIALGILTWWGFRLIANPDFEFRIDSGSQFLFTLWFILFVWVVFRTVHSGFRDFGFFVNIFLLFVQVFTGSLFFSAWFFRRGFSFDFMIRVIQVVIVVQAFFIIVYFLSPAFKEFTLRFIPEGGNVPALHPFRSRGLTHQAGASLAAFQATGMLLSAYLITKRISWKWTVFDVLSMVVLLGSVMLTGRTGFVILPFLLAYFGFYILFKKGLPRKIAYSGILLPLFGIGGFIAVQYIFQTYTGAEAGTDIFRTIGRWMFGEFQQLGETGGSRTIDVLIEEHWFFPDRVGLLLFGDPNTYQVNRVDSDIGIIRRIFGIGIVGLSLTYLLVFSFFYRMAGATENASERLLVICFGVWLFVLELKEPFVTDLRFATLYMMMFCYVCLLPVQKFNRFKLSE
ncbi:MAG: hypothetical protein WD604_18015 [Balneolaceae bacterium]